MSCDYCESADKLPKKKIKYEAYGTKIAEVEVEYCKKCGEQWFDEKTTRYLEKREKEMGIWGLGSKTKVAKVGNSLAVRISKKIRDFVDMKPGEEVFVKPEGKKKIVIELGS